MLFSRRLDEIQTARRRAIGHRVMQFDDSRLRLRQLTRDNAVDQPVIERALRIQIEISAFRVLDDLAEWLTRS